MFSLPLKPRSDKPRVEPTRRRDAQMRVAQEMALVLLAEDVGDEQSTDDWADRFSDGRTPQEVTDDAHNSRIGIWVRVNRLLAKQMSLAAERQGVHRAEWIRRTLAEAVARVWHGQPRPPLLSSFQPEALRAARDSVPGLQRALLLDQPQAEAHEVAAALGCVALITHHKMMDKALVDRVHAAGMRALVYTVNDAARAQALQALGLDGLVTDAVDRLGPGELSSGSPR